MKSPGVAVAPRLSPDAQRALDVTLGLAGVTIGAAVVATLLVPVLPPGIPVLAAALVAVVVGITNWFAPRPVVGEEAS